MTAAEAFSVTVSVLSLFTSGVVAYFAYRLSARQARMGLRAEIGKLIFEINKEVIREPFLNFHKDSVRPPDLPPLDRLQRIKLEAFCHILLNAAELVFTFHHSRKLSPREAQEWAVWQRVFEARLADSSLLREMIERPDVAESHSAEFIAIMRELVSRGHTAAAP